MTAIHTDLPVPTFKDILDAQRIIRPYLDPTPLYRYSAIDALMGTEVHIKHENYQPVGAFKVRGGVNLMARLSDNEKKSGVIAASTGNHGQSVSYAARLFGITARIVVPEGANPGKVAAMEGMGAQVIFHGRNFDEAKTHCEQLAASQGYRYIHSGDEPLLIAGVATETLEMLQAQPGLDVIFVPVGGGSGAAGACLAAKNIDPRIKVIGVQAEGAPSAYLTWKEKRVVDHGARTVAEGLATGTPFALPQTIMARYLDDFFLLSDEEILQAMVWMIEKAHTLAEASGAAALAGAYKRRHEVKGLKIGVICSGGNTSLEHLRLALAETGRS